MKKPYRTKCILALAISLAFGSQAGAMNKAGSGPELRLFSSTVVEDIRRTGDAAALMETDIQASIQGMDQQLELYQAAGCEAAGEDPGCSEMRRQLGQTYSLMLDAMDRALPEMEAAINRSRSGLKDSLSRQLGRSMTPTSIQTMMLDDGPRASVRSSRRSGAAGRLSERFEQYHRLVAGAAASGKRGRGALAVTASDIYLEMEEASQLIALTRDEIARAQLYVDIDNAMPGLTGQMEETVTGVKRILFGEGEFAGVAAAPPAGSVVGGNVTGTYISPLEM